MRAGLIGETMNAAIVLLAILTSTLSPLLFERVLPQGQTERERLLLMVGASENAVMLANSVNPDEFDRIRFIETDPARVQQAERAGFEVILSDAISEEGLKQAGIHSEAVVAVATRDDGLNLKVAELARERFRVHHVVALANTVETAEAMRRIGARPVTPALSTHIVMSNLIHDPDFFGMIQDETVRVSEMVLRDESLHGQRVQDLPLPQGVLVLSIHRQQEHIMPRGQTRLELGDRMTLLGQPEGVKLAEQWLGKAFQSTA